MTIELADASIIALGSHFKSLSGEDIQAIGDLHTNAPSMTQTANAVKGMAKPLPDPAEQGGLPCVFVVAGGDKAACSPTTRVAAAQHIKETLSSTEDDSPLMRLLVVRYPAPSPSPSNSHHSNG